MQSAECSTTRSAEPGGTRQLPTGRAIHRCICCRACTPRDCASGQRSMGLNAAIVDTLRTFSRPKEIPLPEPGDPGEPYIEDVTSASEVWEILQAMLPGEREQRVAYLLFHCGLKPREIMRFCPRQFSNI